jgi:hypothetical protein
MVTVSPLENLHLKQSLIRDRIRGVVHQASNGVYLHGRAGVSKTYLVVETLKQLGARRQYSNGHLTPVGLFELIEANPQSVIVLDDVTSIFGSPKALQILLAALGTSHNGCRTRTIRCKTANTDRVVFFEGSIVAISNLSLGEHSSQVLQALQDRVQVMAYEPTDAEVEAHIYEIAGTSPRGVPVSDAVEVASFLLDECRAIGVRPSLRLFIDKALADFKLWTDQNCESHWQDLVRSSVRQSVILQTHGLRDMTRKDQMASERKLVSEICTTYCSRPERLKAWKQETGKSQSAFYRRVNEIERPAAIST